VDAGGCDQAVGMVKLRWCRKRGLGEDFGKRASVSFRFLAVLYRFLSLFSSFLDYPFLPFSFSFFVYMIYYPNSPPSFNPFSPGPAHTHICFYIVNSTHMHHPVTRMCTHALVLLYYTLLDNFVFLLLCLPSLLGFFARSFFPSIAWPVHILVFLLRFFIPFVSVAFTLNRNGRR